MTLLRLNYSGIDMIIKFEEVLTAMVLPNLRLSQASVLSQRSFLKGYLAAKNLLDNPADPKILHDIVEGSKVCATICDYGFIALN